MVVIDVEATGPDLRTNYADFFNYSILSIGAIHFEDPQNSFYIECRAHRGAKIDKDSLKVAGFTEEEIKDKNKPTPSEAVGEFFNWCKDFNDITFAGNAVFFDYFYFDTIIKKNNLPYAVPQKIVDLHTISYLKHMEAGKEIAMRDRFSKVTLKQTLELVGIDDLDIPHHALEDAKLETECFYRILYGMSCFSEYKRYKVPRYLRVKS